MGPQRKTFLLILALFVVLVTSSGCQEQALVSTSLVQTNATARLITEPDRFAQQFTFGQRFASVRPSAFEQPSASVQQSASRQQQESSGTLSLPLDFQRHLGDLDGMVKRHEIRALVVYSRSGFFYDAGQPEGIYYEALNDFQKFVNQRYRTGALKINVTYIPVRMEQLESALRDGVGDVIAFGVIVTPEREKAALFTTPIDAHVRDVIVTGPKSPAIAKLEDLSGKEIYVNPVTAYYQTLQDASASLVKAGKAPIVLKSAAADLSDEDLLQMVGAGLLPATVTINVRANFWVKVIPRLTPHPDIVLGQEEQLAWVTRKDSPQLRELLDEFIKGREVGTVFGNVMLARYLRNTKFVTGCNFAGGNEKI